MKWVLRVTGNHKMKVRSYDSKRLEENIVVNNKECPRVNMFSYNLDSRS